MAKDKFDFGDGNWYDEDRVHPNTLKAFNKWVATKKSERMAQAFEFVCWACGPGASRWLRRPSGEEKKIPYDGVVCVADFGDYFWDKFNIRPNAGRPLLGVLRDQAKVLTSVGNRITWDTNEEVEHYRLRADGDLPHREPRPRVLPIFRRVLKDLRDLLEELDEDHEWTLRVNEVLYAPDVIKAVEIRKRGGSDGDDTSVIL